MATELEIIPINALNAAKKTFAIIPIILVCTIFLVLFIGPPSDNTLYFSHYSYYKPKISRFKQVPH